MASFRSTPFLQAKCQAARSCAQRWGRTKLTAAAICFPQCGPALPSPRRASVYVGAYVASTNAGAESIGSNHLGLCHFSLQYATPCMPFVHETGFPTLLGTFHCRQLQRCELFDISLSKESCGRKKSGHRLDGVSAFHRVHSIC